MLAFAILRLSAKDFKTLLPVKLSKALIVHICYNRGVSSPPRTFYFSYTGCVDVEGVTSSGIHKTNGDGLEWRLESMSEVDLNR